LDRRSDYRGPAIIARVAHQLLPAAPVDSLKTKVARIGRQRLIAIQADPARGRAGNRSQAALVASDLHFRRSIHHHFERTLAIAAATANIRPDSRAALALCRRNQQRRQRHRITHCPHS
jgi:hypothetical protein